MGLGTFGTFGKNEQELIPKEAQGKNKNNLLMNFILSEFI